jgi:hypothetical protein
MGIIWLVETGDGYVFEGIIGLIYRTLKITRRKKWSRLKWVKSLFRSAQNGWNDQLVQSNFLPQNRFWRSKSHHTALKVL